MRAAVLLLSLLLARAAAAESGVILGTVSDATTKRPTVDVVVTVSSPVLPAEQVVVTGTSGQYRIPELPAGTYSLRFEKQGLQPYTRSGIHLREQRTLRVTVELVPSGEEVLLVRIGPCGPVINPYTTSTEVTVGPDLLRTVPLRP